MTPEEHEEIKSALDELYAQEQLVVYCTGCETETVASRQTHCLQTESGEEMVLTHVCSQCNQRGHVIWRAIGGILFQPANI